MSESPYDFLQYISLEPHKGLFATDGFDLWLMNQMRPPLTKELLAWRAYTHLLRFAPPVRSSRKDRRAAYGQAVVDMLAHLFNLPVEGATKPEE